MKREGRRKFAPTSNTRTRHVVSEPIVKVENKKPSTFKKRRKPIPIVPQGKVAFVGSFAKGSSLNASNAISVLGDEESHQPLQPTAQTQWPPDVPNAFAPITCPFGIPPKSKPLQDGLFFVQLPSQLPIHNLHFHQLSSGQLGKIQVHASGKRTLHLGHLELQVHQGHPSSICQQVWNIKDENATFIGNVDAPLTFTS